MAINPLIALGGQPIDTATPLQNVLTIQDLKQRRDLRERQVAQDERRLAQGDRQLDMQQAEADRAAYKDREESTLLGASVLDSFLADNDIDGAKIYLGRRAKTLIDEGRDPGDTLEALRMIDSDPDQLRAIASAGRREAQARGLISEGETGFTLGEGQARFDAYGRKIAEGPTKDDTMSPERMQQELALRGADSDQIIKREIALERWRREMDKDDPERRLKLEALQNDVDAGRLKVQETQESKERGAGLKENAARLIKDLLADTEAVESVVGPGEKFYPDMARSEKGLQAQTKINQLLNILTAENLGLMTGVLSESDLKVITGIAGGGLDVNGSEEGFINELRRLGSTFGVETGGVESGTTGGNRRIRYDSQGNRID